jgi:hydrogenase nickel incorporation protein HypA/HybF
MHELSLAQGLLSTIDAQVRARRAHRVRRVHLRVGAAAGVEVELLCHWYDVMRAGTVCAGAPLEVERVAERWECPSCGAERPATGRLRCPHCGVALRLTAGDELVLDRLELEVGDV